MKAIQTKCLPATYTRGARIKAFDLDGNQVTLPYDYEGIERMHRKAAYALRDKMGWKGELIGGHIKTGMGLVFKED